MSNTVYGVGAKNTTRAEKRRVERLREWEREANRPRMRGVSEAEARKNAEIKKSRSAETKLDTRGGVAEEPQRAVKKEADR